jgi:hypothetical protein
LNFDPDIFMEVAIHHDSGGADIDLLREGVDYRQKVVLTDFELNSGLEHLSQSRLIRKRGPKYFVSAPIVPSLPRTTSGRLSFRSRDWDELRKTLFES